MKRALGILAWIGLFACSSSNSGVPVPGPDGGAGGSGDDASTSAGDDGSASGDDATTGVVDASDALRATACTAPPFFQFTATVTELKVDNTEGPLAGALVSFSTCPGFSLTTDNTGVAATQVTQNVTFVPLYSADGHVSAVGAESPAFGDSQVSIQLPANAEAAAIPGFSGTAPTIEIVISAEGTSPCDAVDGVSLAVTNHPEATFSYMKPTWPTDANVGSTTASVGPRAFIGGLAGGLKVQVTGTKSGCQVKTVTSTQTGNLSLLAGSLTIAKATVTN